ncbi:hypothetical protein DFH27DRAFT_549584 [Peziza echinospora]|nr:hypothetical protein DFH27DRAFT_549584 [Peziza echinospora]
MLIYLYPTIIILLLFFFLNVVVVYGHSNVFLPTYLPTYLVRYTYMLQLCMLLAVHELGFVFLVVAQFRLVWCGWGKGELNI